MWIRPGPVWQLRRLTTNADVKRRRKRAHSGSVPAEAAIKDANGKYIHEDVWKYLFTHPGTGGETGGSRSDLCEGTRPQEIGTSTKAIVTSSEEGRFEDRG